jgi:hypothetical protein
MYCPAGRLSDASFLDSGPKEGEEVAQGVELFAPVGEQARQSRKLPRMLVGVLAGQFGSVLRDSTLQALALRVEREREGIAVGERVFETRSVRIVPTLQAREEQVDAIGNCG